MLFICFILNQQKIIPFAHLVCSPHQKIYCVKYDVVIRYNKIEKLELIIIKIFYY